MQRNSTWAALSLDMHSSLGICEHSAVLGPCVGGGDLEQRQASLNALVALDDRLAGACDRLSTSDCFTFRVPSPEL